MPDPHFARRRQLVALLGVGLLTLSLCGGAGYLVAGWFVGLYVGATLIVVALGFAAVLLVARPLFRHLRRDSAASPRIPKRP